MRKRSNPLNKLEDDFREKIEKDLKSLSEKILRIFDIFENKPINFSKKQRTKCVTRHVSRQGYETLDHTLMCDLPIGLTYEFFN